MTTTMNDKAGDTVVSLAGIDVRFGARRVLTGLDWGLAAGTVVGLLGRNGAGKTTMIETLLGLRDPDAGRAYLFGQPATRIDDSVRERIGYVPQRADLFDWFTAAQLLDYFRSFYPRWNAAKVDGLMSRWEIARDTPVARLSGGQQQRLSIIRALAHDPTLLVLDEPVASLDPAGRRDFLRELVGEVVDRGTTVVFSTHILSDLERVAVDVAFLAGGRVSLQGALDDLLEDCARLVGAPATVQDFVRRNGLRALGSGDGGLVVQGVAGGAEARGESGVAVERITLEELFIAATNDAPPALATLPELAGAA